MATGTCQHATASDAEYSHIHSIDALHTSTHSDRQSANTKVLEPVSQLLRRALLPLVPSQPASRFPHGPHLSSRSFLFHCPLVRALPACTTSPFVRILSRFGVHAFCHLTVRAVLSHPPKRHYISMSASVPVPAAHTWASPTEVRCPRNFVVLSCACFNFERSIGWHSQRTNEHHWHIILDWSLSACKY